MIYWNDIKSREHDKAVAELYNSQFAVARGAAGADLVLFYIRRSPPGFPLPISFKVLMRPGTEYYCYNVQSVLIFFWSVNPLREETTAN